MVGVILFFLLALLLHFFHHFTKERIAMNDHLSVSPHDSGNDESRRDEELEWELVASALQLSHRISDNTYEPIPYDFHNEDYSYTGKGESVPEELQQLASFFTQMMQAGNAQNESVGGGRGCDSDSGGDDNVDDNDNDDEEEEENGNESDSGVKRDEDVSPSSPRVPNDMHRAVFQCKHEH